MFQVIQVNGIVDDSLEIEFIIADFERDGIKGHKKCDLRSVKIVRVGIESNEIYLIITNLI